MSVTSNPHISPFFPLIGVSGGISIGGFKNPYMAYQGFPFYLPHPPPYYGQFLFPFPYGPTIPGSSSSSILNPYGGMPYGNPYIHQENPHANIAQVIYTNINPCFAPNS